MPSVTLEAVSIDALALTQACVHRFDGSGGTIGRDESNHFVLTDKHRRVSRLHATVTFAEGAATLANASTSLPVVIGEVQLAYGQSVPLALGDLIEIGPYVLRVAQLEDARTGAPFAQPAASQTASVLDSPGLASANAAAPGVIPPSSSPLPSPATSSTAGMGYVDAAGPPADQRLPQDPFSDLLAGLGAGSQAGDGMPLGLPAAALSPSMPVGPADVVRDPLSGFLSTTGDRGLPDPFADLLGASPVAAPPVPGLATPTPFSQPLAASAQTTAAFSPFDSRLGGDLIAPPPKAQAFIPDDFNPFELPSQTARNSADPLAAMAGAPVDAMGRSSGLGQTEPSIDDLLASPLATDPLGFPPAASATDLGAGRDGMQALLPLAEAIDPLALFSDAGARPEAFVPMRDDLAEISSVFTPPQAYHPQPVSPRDRVAEPMALGGGGRHQTTAEVARQSSVSASADALTRAFLEGAGLRPDTLPGGLSPELMRMVGGLLRNATAGAIDMLAARNATKLEVQASVTIIAAAANNPLKFLPNAESALQQLLGKKMPGFMPADEAMKDAFDDLKAHEIGVIAGMRAALTEVLSRFDPATLAQRLTQGSLLDSLLPGSRKTRLWDVYLERYAQIRREAEDDFQSIFGKAFLQAYERETARLKQSVANDRGP